MNMASRQREWQIQNPDKTRAHSAFHYAVKTGRIARPAACSRCKTVGRVEGHHPDYAEPLQVIWLCRNCHAATRKNKGASAMKRTTLFLTEEQVERLNEMAAYKGLNLAQLVRLYINDGLDRERKPRKVRNP